MSEKSLRDEPFFSILIPSYNRPEYIKQCIESILENDFKNYEIIISDDKSPKEHEIRGLIEPYTLFPNIKFFSQKYNLREPGNKNFLVNQAEGKYNIVLGDDDNFFPHTLSSLYKQIAKFSDFDCYAFGYTIIDEHDNFYYKRHAPRPLEVSLKYPSSVQLLFESNLFPFWLYHPATFCCKSGLERELAYSEEAGIGEDFLFLFDLINSGRKMLILPQSLFKWRKVQTISKSKQINQSLGDFSNIQARINIYRHLRDRTDLHPYIANLVDSLRYRTKFIYDSTFLDNSQNKMELLKKELGQKYFDEFTKYSTAATFLKIRIKPYISRSIAYMKLFGFRGITQIASVFIQRFKFNFKKWLNTNSLFKWPD